jgi:hypothetical protein
MAPAMRANINFGLEFCQPMAFALPVGERGLRHVAVSWTTLRQAAACHCLCICGIETEAQGRAENLNHIGRKIQSAISVAI